MLNWLFPEDPDIKHVEISSRRQKNTGDWLLESPEFLSWEEGRLGSQLLWGHGIRMCSLFLLLFWVLYWCTVTAGYAEYPL